MALGGDSALPVLNHEEIIADRSLVGIVFCRAYARRVDEWLQALFERSLGANRGISLVAVGGYGRSTLSPKSDLDLMLLHDGWGQAELEEAAQSLWFPVWDARLALGHSVRTVAQSLTLANEDLETATAMLSLRHLAGDADLSAQLKRQATGQWRKNRRVWLPQIIEDARARGRHNGEVAFLLEPDLKSASGGLRDVNAVQWIEAADIALLEQEERDLAAANDVLLAARVELHRSTSRKGDVLLLQEQDAVARALGSTDADEMMSKIAASARQITWIADDVFLRAQNALRRFKVRSPRKLGGPVLQAEGVVSVDAAADVEHDPALLLRFAVAAARNEARLDRHSLDVLVERGPRVLVPWTAAMRKLFVELLRTGRKAIPVIETLDHVGLFVRLLPEWEPTHSKVQRNQYHRFTVDRHLLEACANAAELIDRVERPDLLLVGALLHDIGKGYPGDHTDVGVELIDTIGPNMAFDHDDVDTLKRLCQHHLLLADVATRRDIHDPGTVAAVAQQVRTPTFVHLLAALTEADSIATGPSAWSRNKAYLTAELARLVEHWLLTDGVAHLGRDFPDSSHRALMAANDHLVTGDGHLLQIVTGDRPGLFARVAGALALCNLSIVDAQIHAEGGKALEVFRVVDADHEDTDVDWRRTIALIEKVLANDDDLTPRFVARQSSILRRKVNAPSVIDGLRVDFDNDMSAQCTVIDVVGRDRPGLLYDVSTALVEARLDIQQARVHTIGSDVVDAFYVQTLDGEKLTDPEAQASLRAALLDVLGAA